MGTVLINSTLNAVILWGLCCCIISSRRVLPFCPPAVTTPSSKQTIMSAVNNKDDEMINNDGNGFFRLGYVTDVEGNLDYFKAYVERSNVLDLKNDNIDNINNEECDDTSLHLDLRDDHCYFVYGGDAVDKGPGDIRLCRALVSLKQRYPNRVHLLVGNRDLNKVRYTAELSEEDMGRPIDDIPPPHWDRNAPSPKEYLQSLLVESSSSSSSSSTGPSDSLDEVNTRVNRLKYLLKHTLGSPNTFEFRRQELAILKGKSESDISDEEIVDNFLFEVEDERGSLRQYLEHGQVAVRIGNTLFCHGAVDANTMKFVPALDSRFENPTSKPPPGKVCEDLNEWIDSLNDFLQRGLQDYRNRPKWNEERNTRGGEALMALQNRPAMWGRSIISNCYGDGGCITTDHAMSILKDPERVAKETSDPRCFEGVSSDPMDEQVSTWLMDHGIQRVVVGHKPTGDCPAVLSAIYTGVEIVSGDTSFSDTSSEDNRGVAIGVVEITGPDNRNNHLELFGTLRDGSSYHSVFPQLSSNGIVDTTTGDALLGQKLDEGWWVKVKKGEDEYLLCRGEGRKVEYRTVSRNSKELHRHTTATSETAVHTA